MKMSFWKAKRIIKNKDLTATFTDVEVIFFRYNDKIYRLDKDGVRSRTYGQITIPLELFEDDRIEVELLEIHFKEEVKEVEEEEKEEDDGIIFEG